MVEGVQVLTGANFHLQPVCPKGDRAKTVEAKQIAEPRSNLTNWNKKKATAEDVWQFDLMPDASWSRPLLTE